MMQETTDARTDELVERYVAAVARHLPAAQRSDVADELRASILDSIEDRANGVEEMEAVTRGVLSELGDPELLSREYDSGPRHLIGPRYYDDWWTTLRALVAAVVPIVVVVVLVVDLAYQEGPLPEAVIGAVWTGFATAVHLFFWVTLSFWVLERSGTPSGQQALREGWSVDDLPDVPRVRQNGLSELVWGAGIMLVVLAWLPWQHFRSPIRRDGERVPMLEPALWSDWLWVVVALFAAGVVFEVVKYVVGVWTTPITAISVLLDAALAVVLVALVLTADLVNPALTEGVDVDLGDGIAALSVVTFPEAIVAVSAVVIAVLGITDAVRKHLEHRRTVAAGG